MKINFYKYCLSSLVLLVFTIGQVFGNTTIKASKWETVDLVFKSSKTIANPFDVELTAEFTHADGSKLTVSGFYNDNNEWLVRFTPNKTGVWKAISQSSVKALDHKIYTLEIAPAKKGNRGGVQISKTNKQKLSYADGTAYNMIAFECDWLFALDYDDEELTKTKSLINEVSANGFNQIIMNVYAYDVDWKQGDNILDKFQFGGKKDIYPFLGTNEKPDYSALNIDFFKHLDRVVQLLNDHGIVAHVMIYVWNKQVNWPKGNSKADNMYFDYVVKRYQAYNNILWDVSKEALRYGRDDESYIVERIERLRTLDVYNRLITVHDYEYCSKYPETVDLISVQFWDTDIYSEMLNMKKTFPNKPILNVEHGGYEKCQYDIFEGNYDSPIVCLERNYKCAFAGSYSTYYWQGAAWNVVMYEPFSKEVTKQPKFEYYKYMREFLDKINYTSLEPNKEYSASGYCLANEADGEYVYYMPKDNSAMAVRRLPKAEKMKIQWFNPLTGEYSKPEIIDYTGWLMLYPHFKAIDNVVIVNLLNPKEE